MQSRRPWSEYRFRRLQSETKFRIRLKSFLIGTPVILLLGGFFALCEWQRIPIPGQLGIRIIYGAMALGFLIGFIAFKYMEYHERRRLWELAMRRDSPSDDVET